MTVVVADTSPLNYLALIELIDVLPRLYGIVVIPQEVLSELTSPAAPREVRGWAKTLPDWIEVRSVPVSDDRALSNLDPGERSAIALAQSETNALLWIDEDRWTTRGVTAPYFQHGNALESFAPRHSAN